MQLMIGEDDSLGANTFRYRQSSLYVAGLHATCDRVCMAAPNEVIPYHVPGGRLQRCGQPRKYEMHALTCMGTRFTTMKMDTYHGHA